MKDFYTNEELINLTRELTDTLRKNQTIDWNKKEGARAKMRVMIKKLLKKYKYPPEGAEEAMQTVMAQCNQWASKEENFEHVTMTYNLRPLIRPYFSDDEMEHTTTRMVADDDEREG